MVRPTTSLCEARFSVSRRRGRRGYRKIAIGTKIGARFSLALALLRVISTGSHPSTMKPSETEGLVGQSNPVRFVLNDIARLLKNAEIGQDALVNIVLGTILALIVLILAGILITRNITKPHNEISGTSEEIVSGERNVLMSAIDRADEIGALVQTFSRMSQSLASEIVAATTQIASGAGVKQSKESVESIRILAASVAEAAQEAAQIAASAQQQLVGIDQVAFAIKNHRRASMQNVASTKKPERAVRDLHELGKRLKQLTDHC